MSFRALVYLARKDLFKDKRVLILVLLAIGSGALAIIPLNGLLGGFINNISEMTIDVSVGHVIVSPGKGQANITNGTERARQIEEMSDVVGVSPRLLEKAIAKIGNSTDSMVLRGVEPSAEESTTAIAQKVTQGDFLDDSDTGGVVVGQTLAGDLDLQVGGPVTFVFPNGAQQSFTVKGIYLSGQRDLDTGGYALIGQLREAAGVGSNEVSEISIRLDDINKSTAVKESLARDWSVTVETWQDRLGFVGQVQRNLNIIQTFVIVLSLIAAGITTSVLMYTNILHKTRSIGILKAIGSNNRGVLSIFLAQGVLLGIGGALVGDLLGSGICLFLTRHAISATTGAAQGETSTVSLKATYSLLYLVLPTISAVVITILASCYPAWRASRINIIEAIWKG